MGPIRPLSEILGESECRAVSLSRAMGGVSRVALAGPLRINGPHSAVPPRSTSPQRSLPSDP